MFTAAFLYWVKHNRRWV